MSSLSANALSYPKMNLWKWVAFVLMLCGAALSVFLSKSLLSPKVHTTLHFGLLFSTSLSPKMSLPSLPESSKSSDNSTSGNGVKFRNIRSANSDSSVISEFMHIFQSFTKSEVKQVISALVQRKAWKDAKQGKRTKRAKKGIKPCSLRDMEVTVSQLGLGYISDEIIRFRYCSGRCMARRRNYDLSLTFLKRKHLLTRESRNKARHSPCCRPTAYEKDTSFLDSSNHYHTIYEVSALECGCI